MRFDEMTPLEKVEYKKKVLKDFVDHGMTDDEALVNYVHLVNADPYKWMQHKYCMDQPTCESLRESGAEKYVKNGGTIVLETAAPKKKKKHACKCKKAIVPE